MKRLCLFPVTKAGTGSHDKTHGDGQRQGRAHIKVRVDGSRLAEELRKERHRHADEYDGRDEDEQQRPQKQAELAARIVFVYLALRQAARLEREQHKAAYEHDGIGNGQRHANARAAERVDREIAENAAARQERAIDDECERENDGEMQHK